MLAAETAVIASNRNAPDPNGHTLMGYPVGKPGRGKGESSVIRIVGLSTTAAVTAAVIVLGGTTAPAQAAPFASCKEAKANNVCDITEDSPYWSDGQDRDDDGIACEC